MPAVTAIVLSAHPVSLALPGVTVLSSVQKIDSVAQLHAARLAALRLVTTPFCFYLDDDDELPADYLSVLEECVSKMQERDVPMAYTDEILREPGKDDVRRSWYDYDHDRHKRAPMAVHHLALMDTRKAREVASNLPQGDFWTEHILYWSLGRYGAAYVPRVGYIWNRSKSGVSRWPQMLTAQMNVVRWCAGGRS